MQDTHGVICRNNPQVISLCASSLINLQRVNTLDTDMKPCLCYFTRITHLTTLKILLKYIGHNVKSVSIVAMYR